MQVTVALFVLKSESKSTPTRHSSSKLLFPGTPQKHCSDTARRKTMEQ